MMIRAGVRTVLRFAGSIAAVLCVAAMFYLVRYGMLKLLITYMEMAEQPKD